MTDLVRFSVSMESDLLAQFDRFCAEGKLATRSEAVRQLIREKLTAAAWEAEARDVAANLTLVYDHHRANLSDKLVDLQHAHTDLIVATMHIHLDHDHCMEIIVMRGRADQLQHIASELSGQKGIHQAQLVVARAQEHSGHNHHK